MASRPIFRVAEAPELVTEVGMTFEWSPGFALSQKQKNIEALHQAANDRGIGPVLEVSSKSSDRLGSQLSAFHMTLPVQGNEIPVESVFQASKVYRDGGPFTDLLQRRPIDAKRDPRHGNSGPLIAFRSGSGDWPLTTGTLFYDYLFMRALARSDEARAVTEYLSFSDIEFNPERSLNCQARSCALFVSLHRRGLLDASLDDEGFLASATREYVVATLAANPSHRKDMTFDI